MFSFPPATWMFRFAGLASALCGCRASRAAGSPIRAPADPWLLAPPRGLSRPAAPFVAPGSQRHPPCALSRSLAAGRLRPRPSVLFPGTLTRPGALAFARSRLSRLSQPLFLFSLVCLAFSSLSPPVNEPSRALRPRCVENVGLEPTTPGLQSRCSSQLSQSPADACVVPGRLELPTPTLSVWCSNRLSYGTPGPGDAPSRAPPARSLIRPARNLGFRYALQKGGVPAAPSGTATLLRLSPSHHVRPRQGMSPDFRRPRLPWLDGRCVQGPGTYSPRHG